ncbi:MAG: bifunctional phosphopantothenoylcysteine decarboxylase/phosphopantothenate--cysteine ligase CoaBC [Gammaproteobacteria bacterium]|nr:bifunctional phosphopantothenoylcysteine decarboxylase/phosphopantothenate--cysteine ligase CoaBC [Gammaproteobacteria bacterium]
MNGLAKKRILVGVTGGIAAYKSAALVRLLVKAGAEVRVVMTRAATTFVTPLTFQALSGNSVGVEFMDNERESAMGHIELARWADLVVIAPAGANYLAKLAHGLADDLLSTLSLATTAPIFLAPAMNRWMWLADATRGNHAVLRNRGVAFIGPDDGEQACGESGPGRMLEPDTILARLEEMCRQGELAGLSLLITAGPTRESLDPVRFIGNRSSGRMGYALAESAARAGGRVTIVSGPVSLMTPPGVDRVDVISAADMHAAVQGHVSGVDIFIAAAAVADYRPTAYSPEKIKKDQATLMIALERTTDILAEVGKLPNGPFTVGFAAETGELAANACKKLRDKNLDMVVANRVGESGPGIESEDNALHVFWSGGEREFPLAHKSELARGLIQLIAECYEKKG